MVAFVMEGHIRYSSRLCDLSLAKTKHTSGGRTLKNLANAIDQPVFATCWIVRRYTFYVLYIKILSEFVFAYRKDPLIKPEFHHSKDLLCCIVSTQPSYHRSLIVN